MTATNATENSTEHDMTTNPSPRAVLRQLKQSLLQQLELHPHCHWYALIDGAQLPDIVGQLRGRLLDVPKRCLFEDSTEEDPSEVAPYLLQLDVAELRRPVIAYTRAHALDSHAVSWLASPLDLPGLAERLSARFDATLSENMEVLFRYYDTRILSILPAVLSTEQSTEFFSIAHGWWYPDRDGVLQSLACAFTERDAFVAPILISQAQEDAILDAGFPDTVLGALREEYDDLLVGMGRGEQHAFVLRQLDKTKALGADAIIDIVRYCIVSLTEGEDFADRAPWLDKIAAIKSGSLTMKALLL